MMKKIISITFVLMISFMGLSKSIGVAGINTYKVFVSPETASQLVRLELIKIGDYSVLDRFDMEEISDPAKYKDCFAKNCLIEFGKELKVDYVMSGSIDKIESKIVITLKLLDIKEEKVVKTSSMEFADNEPEIQRMIGIMVKKMHGKQVDPELQKRLQFENEVITSNNIGRINNSGPRIGLAYGFGAIGEFFERESTRGGLEIFPVVSSLGYQFEVQYVGTEKFSALFEFIPLLLGLEQGQFIPTVAVMNGMRWGDAGWEFAFGPSFGISKVSYGFFDNYTDPSGNIVGIYDTDNPGRYWTTSDLSNNGFDPEGYRENGYYMERFGDSRGDVVLSTRWIMAFGRTFRSGALNIPVNAYVSTMKGGGMVGLSMGFNITRSKKSVN
jgi:hypothetical protein